MDTCEVTAGIVALANIVASNLTEEELALLILKVNYFRDTLSTIALHRAFLEKHKK